jgi:solute carrier family 35, member F5
LLTRLGIWTLIFGALVKVESFTLRKMLAVLASMAGIILISTVDMSGDNDKHRGTFPHKSQGEIGIGDLMALVSAILYGIYIIIMRKSVGNENRVNMLLFFGFIGAFNLVILWPGFFILHLTGIEKFGLPQTRRIWMIILVSSPDSPLSAFDSRG